MLYEDIKHWDNQLTEDDFYDALTFILADAYPHLDEEELEDLLDDYLDQLPDYQAEALMDSVANVAKQVGGGALNFIRNNPGLIKGIASGVGMLGGPAVSMLAGKAAGMATNALAKTTPNPSVGKVTALVNNPQVQTALVRGTLGLDSAPHANKQNGQVNQMPLAIYLRAIIASAQAALVELEKGGAASGLSEEIYGEDADSQAEWLAEELGGELYTEDYKTPTWGYSIEGWFSPDNKSVNINLFNKWKNKYHKEYIKGFENAKLGIDGFPVPVVFGNRRFRYHNMIEIYADLKLTKSELSNCTFDFQRFKIKDQIIIYTNKWRYLVNDNFDVLYNKFKLLLDPNLIYYLVNDDRNQGDEYSKPTIQKNFQYRIYSMDSPGIGANYIETVLADYPSATKIVVYGYYSEYIKVEDKSKGSNPEIINSFFEWSSMMLLEKALLDGKWYVNKSKSYIGKGEYPVDLNKL